MTDQDVPFQKFTGPFYEQRAGLVNHDRRDNRPGANPYPPRLDRLVTLKDMGGMGPDGNPDSHSRAWRSLGKTIHEGLIALAGGKRVPFLGTRIRDKHALSQEISAGLVSMPMPEIQALVQLPRERKFHERRDMEGGTDAAAA